MMDWGLFGYYVGEVVQDEIPALDGVRSEPNLEQLKHFGASAASSGGVEMYHMPGVTPEARALAEAFGGRQPAATHRLRRGRTQIAYESLNAGASDPNVDFIMLGCPHNSIEQVWAAPGCWKASESARIPIFGCTRRARSRRSPIAAATPT